MNIKLWFKRLVYAALIFHAVTWIGSDETVKQGFGMVLMTLYYLIYLNDRPRS